jgi:N-acyl-D-amino-acid deacylase
LNKILIKNGTIVDGTGENRYKADLLIRDNTIDKIGQINENSQNFNRVIDANGMVICPGFIDAHSHSDLGILLDPYVEPKIRQGITTEIIGQDGVSMAPLHLNM